MITDNSDWVGMYLVIKELESKVKNGSIVDIKVSHSVIDGLDIRFTWNTHNSDELKIYRLIITRDELDNYYSSSVNITEMVVNKVNEEFAKYMESGGRKFVYANMQDTTPPLSEPE